MPVKINGSTSGSVTLAAPATGSDVTLTLPAATGTAATSADVTTAVAPMGLVAVAPTSIANSGGSASLSNYTVSFSGVSSVSLNGVFTGDYDNYRVVMNLTSAANVDLYCRLRASGTDNSTSSSYVNQYLFAGGTSVSANAFTNNFWEVFAALASTRRNGIVCDFFSPAQSVETAYILLDRYSQLLMTGGNHTATSAFDGFTLYPASSTFSGSVSVYGYKK